MKKILRFKVRKAFTLMELIISIVLMTFLMAIIGTIVLMSISAYTNTNENLENYNSNTEFMLKINDSIRKAGAAFTVPRDSFTEQKLDDGWNYLGMMKNVKISPSMSHTGEEYVATNALVYITSCGSRIPTNVPYDSNLIHNDKGYFIQKVIAYEYTKNDKEYKLDFKLNPIDDQLSSQRVAFDFKSYYIKDGKKVELTTNADVTTNLTALNSMQIVYKGSESNPATALAFRNDILPLLPEREKASITVVYVLDFSGSMRATFDGTTRILGLKKVLKESIESNYASCKNNKVEFNAVIVPFGSYAGQMFSRNEDPEWTFTIEDDEDLEEVKEYVERLERPDVMYSNTLSGTNVGDGLRQAYYQTKELVDDEEAGKIFLTLLTDGTITTYSTTTYDVDTGLKYYRPYMGDEWLGSEYTVYGSGRYSSYWNDYVSYSFNERKRGYFGWVYAESFFYDYRYHSYRNNETGMKNARQYAKDWGNMFKDEFLSDAKKEENRTILISLASGMGEEDEKIFKDIFDTVAVEANNMAELSNAFGSINTNIEDIMYAFDGPRM